MFLRCFCSRPKEIQFVVVKDERNQEIFTFKKLEFSFYIQKITKLLSKSLLIDENLWIDHCSER